MVEAIKIYVEGGGKGTNKNATIKLQRGFDAFLKELKELANAKKIRLQIIPSGSTDETYDQFILAVENSPQSFNLLLVDSDEAVADNQTARVFLQNKHKKWRLEHVDDEQCHLMVQIMESWFIADVDALKTYYGQGFKESVIPQNQNVEEIAKKTVEKSLKDATAKTKKGRYHKIKHGGDLLERVEAKKVRQAAHFCEILFQVITKKIG